MRRKGKEEKTGKRKGNGADCWGQRRAQTKKQKKKEVKSKWERKKKSSERKKIYAIKLFYFLNKLLRSSSLCEWNGYLYNKWVNEHIFSIVSMLHE